MHECLLLTKNLYVGLLLCKRVSVQNVFQILEWKKKKKRAVHVENILFRDHSLVMVERAVTQWIYEPRSAGATQGGWGHSKGFWQNMVRLEERMANHLKENSINSHTLGDDGRQMGLACLRSLGLQRAWTRLSDWTTTWESIESQALGPWHQVKSNVKISLRYHFLAFLPPFWSLPATVGQPPPWGMCGDHGAPGTTAKPGMSFPSSNGRVGVSVVQRFLSCSSRLPWPRWTSALCWPHAY